MSNLPVQAKEIANLFRLSKHIEAGLLLAEYFDRLLTFNSANDKDLENAISSILSCQERKDWLGLADYLEFELVHIIGGEVSSIA